jgi:hypothetical protein
VFLCFFAIGGLTVVMAGGVSARSKPVPRPVEATLAPADGESESVTGLVDVGPDAEAAPLADTDEQFSPERPLDAPESDAATASGPAADPGLKPTPEPEPGLKPPPEPEPEPEPGPPPPPVKPAPDVEDVEDLMFVDDDIETGRRPRRPQPPAGTG